MTEKGCPVFQFMIRKKLIASQAFRSGRPESLENAETREGFTLEEYLGSMQPADGTLIGFHLSRGKDYEK